MATFLSDEWFTEVEKIRSAHGDPPASGPMATVELNVVVTGGPEGQREVHLAGGNFAAGPLATASTKLTVPYDLARKLFIEADMAAAMPAFMSGQIKVEGDMSKLMGMAGGGQTISEEQEAVQEAIKAVTD